jgi:pyrroloquinoline quinone biosynthesis protein E
VPKAGSDVSLDGLGKPLWLALELTYRCPLTCPWCNNPLDFESYRRGLTTDEWKRVLREGRELGALQLGFTGGEPAMREDLEALVEEGNRLGLFTNLVTSGMGLDRERLAGLKELGLRQIRLSLESCRREVADALVGGEAFAHKLAVADAIKGLGYPLALNVPLCRQNIDDTADILAMAERIGVDSLEFVSIQYYNWAMLNLPALLPTRDQLSRAETAVDEGRARLGERMTIYFVIPDYYGGRPKGCMNGWGSIYLTIAPDGTAIPCQEARVIADIDFPSVRDKSLAWIWHDSPAFNKFRGDAWMSEPCHSCDERTTDFGGCRCQAYLLTGDAARTDPACRLSPDHGLIEASVAEAAQPRHERTPLVRRHPGSVTTAFTGGAA